MADQKQLPFASRLTAAAGASGISAIVTNPLEVLKTRLQAQLNATESSNPPQAQGASRTGSEGIYSRLDSRQGARTARDVPRQPPAAPTTSLKLIRHIWVQEGPFAFWRGLRPNILAAVPTVGIYMPLYDHLHTIFTPTAGAAAPLAAGVCSRTAAVLLVAPLELVRTRIMAVPATPRALLVAATPNLPVSFSFPQHSVLWPTVTGLWRGVGATVRFFFLRIIENYPKS